MKMVSSCRLRCLLLLLLSFTASISCSSAAQRDSKLRLLLHRTPLLGSKQVRDTQRHSDRQLRDRQLTDRQTAERQTADRQTDS
uniref:Secreted protein n=1 Tax=Sparus aurata TaxID=8175 RepID=A0A671WVL0_SPAAU